MRVMLYDSLKIKNFKFFEYYNPMAFGIITNDNLDNKELFVLKKIEENNITQTIDKKITISKDSIIILIAFLVLCIINMFL